jgi:hypothetical protein
LKKANLFKDPNYETHIQNLYTSALQLKEYDDIEDIISKPIANARKKLKNPTSQDPN